jgi:hypothetical protein
MHMGLTGYSGVPTFRNNVLSPSTSKPHISHAPLSIPVVVISLIVKGAGDVGSGTRRIHTFALFFTKGFLGHPVS